MTLFMHEIGNITENLTHTTTGLLLNFTLYLCYIKKFPIVCSGLV